MDSSDAYEQVNIDLEVLRFELPFAKDQLCLAVRNYGSDRSQPPYEAGSKSGPVNQAHWLACEPLLQKGQAHQGARLSRDRGVAGEPFAPVGQADWGRALEPPTGLPRRS
jgi:hypothetical protein